MSTMEIMRDWLGQLTELRKFKFKFGYWLNFINSESNRYATLAQVGGKTGMLNVRYPHYELTLIGVESKTESARQQEILELIALCDDIVRLTQQVPELCNAVNIQIVGEIVGPILTNAGRPALNLTLELIYND